MREAGYAVSMITGDRDENAKAVAEQIGIQEYYSALSPEEKIEFIHHFKSRLKSPIAMVGDGINDAPAFAVADLGIAVGTVEAVAESSVVVLPSIGSACNIGSLITFLKISNAASKTVLYNIAIILAVKVAAAVLGVASLLPIWAVVAIGDDGSLIVALLNTLLLLRKKLSHEKSF